MILTLLMVTLSFMPLCADAAASTVVVLTDVELNELLQIVFSQLHGSTLISITLLESLGLNTSTVISLLEKIGYTILW